MSESGNFVEKFFIDRESFVGLLEIKVRTNPAGIFPDDLFIP